MSAFRCRPLEEKVKEFAKIYKAPKNVTRLQVPNTNRDVWEIMKKGAQIVDASTQKVQGLMVSMLSVLTKLMDSICSDTAGSCADHMRELSDTVTMGVMMFCYLSQIRKDVIRNSIGHPIIRFCTWDTMVGKSELFENLPKKMMERDENQLKLRCRGGYR